jgi:translation initiation factor 3 subunit E
VTVKQQQTRKLSSREVSPEQTMTMTEATAGIEEWDLTSKVSPYLDRHMMFPLLDYLDEQINAGTVSYSSNDVAAARLALLRPTHMVDYAEDIYRGINGADSEIPQEMEEQKKSVYVKLEELKVGCKPLHDLCNNEEERVSKYVKS